MRNPLTLILALFAAALVTSAPAVATVKITALGSHDGEFCPLDRAMIFEDPDGTRILYDPGRTVRGPEDPRLGHIDAVLLSHVHGDHLGDVIQPEANAGTCAEPDFSVSVTPASNTVNIVVGKKARFIVGGEMPGFFGPAVEAAGGERSQINLVRFGASTMVGGVTVASVPAVHSNGLSPIFIGTDYAKLLAQIGLTAYVGPPGGFVVQFSNGLVAYLSGDTGITAEQDVVVNRHYNANLAVINIGDTFTTGPTEAAYVINDLVQPASVIASHANEEATRNGELVPGSRTDTFRGAVNVPTHIPLSGVTMEFDGQGNCVTGC